jgi:hypothetical protein
MNLSSLTGIVCVALPGLQKNRKNRSPYSSPVFFRTWHNAENQSIKNYALALSG